MHVFDYVYVCEFRDEILVRGGECKTSENFKFKFFKKKRKKKEKGSKIVVYRNSPEKSWDFSRSQMAKRIAPLELSHEI